MAKRGAALTALLFTGAALGAVPAAGAENEGVGAKVVAVPRPKLITVDYVNAEIRDVIRALAAQSGVNLALNPEVKGQVTVHLKDKTVDEAIVMTANLAGLGAKKVKETFFIAPRNEMRSTMERLGTSRRVALARLDPKAAADLAQNSFPDVTARIQDKGITLLGSEDEIRDAAKIIEAQDLISPDSARQVEKLELKPHPRGLRHLSY